MSVVTYTPAARPAKHSLEAWGLRLGVPKIGTDIADWSKWTPELQARCVGDVRACMALWRFLKPDGYEQQPLELEHRVALICERISADGAPFDREAAVELRDRWESRRAELLASIEKQLPGLNPNSRIQIGRLLEERGWVPEKRTEKTGQPAIDDELLETIPEVYPEFAGLAEYDLLRRRCAQLDGGKKAWLANIAEDGRIHGGLVHIGTPHFRAKHLEPNLAAVPSAKKGGLYAKECRALFHAPEGWAFVTCDQANLQDRAFAHHIAAFDGGAYARAFLDGADQHWQSAIALGLVPSGTQRDKENDVHTALREGAKRFRYAFLFGAGNERAGRIIYDIARAARQLDPANGLQQHLFGGTAHPSLAALKRVGRNARDKFIAAHPGLGQLRTAVEKQVETCGWLAGLDGRRVPVGAQYKALNYAVTSAEAIVCKRWLVNVHDELQQRFRYGWNGDAVICLWIHDEIAVCCRAEIAEQVGEMLVRHAKEAGEYYRFNVPLDAEYKVGRSWAGEPDPAVIEANGAKVNSARSTIMLPEDAEPPPFEAEPEPEPQPKQETPKANGQTGSADPSGHLHGAKPDQYVCSFMYRNAAGEDYERVDKYVDSATGKKGFPSVHKENGKWVKGAPAIRLPFGLPELLKAGRADQDLHITEGEKDALTLRTLGYHATTNPGGAKVWQPELTPWLQGWGRYIIHEDNDEDGRRHTALVGEALKVFGKPIKVVSYRALPEGGDVSDWLVSGHTKAELNARIETSPEHEFVPAKITILDIRRWDHEPVPEQEWSVHERFPLRQAVLLSGEGGFGKSFAALQLCAGHAAGRDWFGLRLRPGPAILVDAEDDPRVLQYRLTTIARHLGTTCTALADAGLNVVSLVGEDAVLGALARKTGIIEPTERYRRLHETVGDVKPVMTAIASSADVFAGNELDRAQVRQFVSLLTRLGITANGTVMLISHPSLTGINTGTGLSGSTQWHNAVRARAVMKMVKPEDGEPADPDLRQIEFHKNQYGSIGATVFVRFEDGLFLPVSGMNAENRADAEARAEQVFLELLRRFHRENRNVSDRRGTNYAPALFADEPEARASGVTKPMLTGAMRRLFAAGTIWNEPYGRQARPNYRIIVKTHH
jgi:RecA-family ATPase/DNA polymerase I-like protein with 3'-5' exonuclease and polymerase domains